MNKAARDKWGEKLAAVDRVFAETDDHNLPWARLRTGVLEWAASVVRVPCPTMTDVAAAPARHVGAPLVVACHDGATRYTPPTKERGRPSNVFPHVCQERCQGVAGPRPDPSTARLRRCARRRWASRSCPPSRWGTRTACARARRERLDDEGPINGHDPTPWAIRLTSGLRDRGVEVQLSTRSVPPRWRGPGPRVPHRRGGGGPRFAIEVDGRLRAPRRGTRQGQPQERGAAGAGLAAAPGAERIASNRPDDVAEVVAGSAPSWRPSPRASGSWAPEQGRSRALLSDGGSW